MPDVNARLREVQAGDGVNDDDDEDDKVVARGEAILGLIILVVGLAIATPFIIVLWKWALS